MAAKKNYYAVRAGRAPGIYTSWGECERQVKGYPGAEYKGFVGKSEALVWMKGKTSHGNGEKAFPGKHRKESDERIRKEHHGALREELLKNTPEGRGRLRTNLIKYEELNEEQKQAFAQMEKGENIFLSGEAGTGKSFLLRYFIQQTADKNVVVCAPTGIAALQVGGATIHRMFQVKSGPISPDKTPPGNQKIIRAADIIIIDEISMCRFDLFDYVCRTIREAEKTAKRRKQLIVVGDFYQLPPVMQKSEKQALAQVWGREGEDMAGFAFEAPMWEQMNFCSVILHTVMRQQGEYEFIENLNKIRRGDKSALQWFHENTAPEPQEGIFLCDKNSTAAALNNREMEKLNQKIQIYQGTAAGAIKDFPTEKKLKLCKDARVMALINDGRGHYRNGSLGTVEELKPSSVIVRFDNGNREEVEAYTWEAVSYQVITDPDTGKSRIEKQVIGTFTQLPLKIAFAITMHKSQGQTFERANLTPGCFEKGQLYVALSRVTRADRLYLTRPIEEKDLKAAGEVKDFYDALEQKNGE